MNETADELVFVPLGGLGEIGMNMALYGFGPRRKKKWLMVDCGIAFAGPEQAGIDVIVPDTTFIEKMRGDLVGICITHAHEDHIGADHRPVGSARRAGLRDALRRRPARDEEAATSPARRSSTCIRSPRAVR